MIPFLNGLFISKISHWKRFHSSLIFERILTNDFVKGSVSFFILVNDFALIHDFGYRNDF